MTVAADARTVRRVPTVWLWAVTLVLGVIAVGPLLPSPLTLNVPDIVWYLLYPGMSAAQAFLFFRAARRAELGSRLTQALRLTAAAFTVSVAATLPDLFTFLGSPIPVNPAALSAITFTSYALGLAGMLRLPMRIGPRASWVVFLLDLSTAVLGLGSVLALMVTVPQLREAHGDSYRDVLTYGLAQGLMLVGLNALILRAVARPSSRAFWLFIGSLLCNLAAATIRQFPEQQPLVDLAVLAKGALLFWAAVAYASDPIAPGEPAPTPEWMNSFNPLPIVATAGMLALLADGAFRQDALLLRILPFVVVAQVSMLIGRLFFTARENARLMAEQAARERVLNEAKMQAVGRLAGGIAHWFNNLLTTVIGHAELGVLAARQEARVVDDFGHIRAAANRAAQLTRQLLAFSGQEYVRLAAVDLREFVVGLEPVIGANLPPNVRLVTVIDQDQAAVGDRVDRGSRVALGGCTVMADRRLLESVLRELVSNAAEAMPDGGVVTVRVSSEQASASAGDVVLPLGPGPQVALEVEDSGVGMTPEVRRAMFDPFFTTKPIQSAAGLGLAAVYGIVAAHQGGIDVASEVGRGTRIRIRLPKQVGAPTPVSAAPRQGSPAATA